MRQLEIVLTDEIRTGMMVVFHDEWRTVIAVDTLSDGQMRVTLAGGWKLYPVPGNTIRVIK